MRALLLPCLLLLPLAAQARTILYRPMQLDTGQGVLQGSLLMPKSDRPLPVALLIAGSGPTDRDGNNPMGRNDSLKRLAQALAERGIATLRYDKRGVAASRPAAPDERALSLPGYVDDAVAWGQSLKHDPRFSRLVLIGHSEGALVATLAAPRAQADAVVSLAGSGRPIDRLLREQLQGRLPPPLLARADALIDTLKAGHCDDQVPEPLQVLLRPSVQPYLISLFQVDPAAAFGRLRMPALIIQGRNDIQVGVEDALALQQAKPDAELALIDGMNHVLRIVPLERQAQLASYNDPQRPLAREPVLRIVHFIDQLHYSDGVAGR